ADFVANKKPTESALELRSDFDTLKRNSFINIPQDNIGFVEKIREEAKYFEEVVKNYLGTDISTEYSMIEENLLLLLDALDAIDCTKNPSIFKVVIEVIAYVNKILHQLASNASNN